jgi:acyl dehydratase
MRQRSGFVIEWFDDLAVGMRFKSPDKLVTREDIKRFASEFDPQPYHLDETAAERVRRLSTCRASAATMNSEVTRIHRADYLSGGRIS